MKTVSKSILKAKMLEYLRRVEQTGEELVVTSHGRPVVRVVPFSIKRTPDEAFGDLRGKVVYHEDIFIPTTDEWTET